MCEDVPGQGPPLDSDGNYIYCTREQLAGNQSYCCLEQCINEITIETPLNLNQICGPPPGQHSNTYLSFYNNAVVPQQSNGILNLYRPGVFQISNFSHNTHDNTSSVLKREVKRKRHEYPSHIRIKKITDATPTEKTSRRFIYKMDLDSDESSAVILSNASFSKSKIVTKKAYSYSTGSSACEQNNQTIITYFSSNSNNNPYQDHVVYERVFEITESESGYNLGYTVYDFHTGESGVLQNSKAFHWDYDHKVGNLKSKKIFNRQQDITFEEEYIYENIQLSSNNNNHLYSYFGGLQTNYMDEYDATFPLLVKPINHSTFNLLLHEPWWTCFGGFCCLLPNNPLNNPSIVQNLQNQYSQILSIGDRGTLSFDTSPIGSSVSLGFNKKTITKEYFTNGVIENEVENNYDENQYYLLTETVQNNNGDTLRNVFYYPEEFSNHHFLNRLTDVVRSDSFKNDKLLGSKKYNYSMHSGNRLLLDRIDFKKEEQMEYEPRIYFLYDQLSNIIEVKNALNNPSFKTAYIWGYNNRFMVGEVKNALFSELPLNQVNTIKNITNSSNNANQFNTAFEQLRANMPNSFISSFYYDSQRNLRIMSDYKNDKVFYDFAPLGRLQFIKDKDGNILSQNQYNYKENN